LFNAAAALGGKGWDHSASCAILEHLAGHEVAKGSASYRPLRSLLGFLARGAPGPEQTDAPHTAVAYYR